MCIQVSLPVGCFHPAAHQNLLLTCSQLGVDVNKGHFLECPFSPLPSVSGLGFGRLSSFADHSDLHLKVGVDVITGPFG